ncbi:hypothetical protein [Nocardioides terrisoli]|uniref:hypothetical protein n=1 Tax=Nocardioides terrisoli TaxID=3388267 RepID=UPI00287BA5E4|nr:hypothetical protein [Nocardioides marmorisolisilvae]
MTDDRADDEQDASGRPPVGSVAEEAAALLAALSGFAKEQGSQYAGAASGVATAASESLHNLNEHIATGSKDCVYCPVCQVIHAVRATSPEVRTNLAIAANALAQAAAGMLASHVPTDESGPVQKIDLDDGSDWEDS